MSKVNYSVADGHVFRGSEKVAAYEAETGVLDFLPGMANYRAPVVRYLREQGLMAEVAPDRPEDQGEQPAANLAGVNPDRPADVVEAVDPVIPVDVAATAKNVSKVSVFRDRLTPEGWV